MQPRWVFVGPLAAALSPRRLAVVNAADFFLHRPCTNRVILEVLCIRH